MSLVYGRPFRPCTQYVVKWLKITCAV